MAGQQLRASHIALGKRPMPSEFEDSPPAPMRPRTYSGTPIGQNRSHLSALAEAAFSFSSPSSNAHSSQHIPLDPEAPSARKQLRHERERCRSQDNYPSIRPRGSCLNHIFG
nr:hypothetical protein HK105_006241 [Polyrhizophydium stewartii]